MPWTPSMNCIPPSQGGACPLSAASPPLHHALCPLPLHACYDSQVLINYGGLSASWAWTPGFSPQPVLLLPLLPAKLTSQTNILSRCFPHINNQNWHILNEGLFVVQGSSDGYVGESTASEECFCHYQHFSDRFLIVPLKLQYIGKFCRWSTKGCCDSETLGWKNTVWETLSSSNNDALRRSWSDVWLGWKLGKGQFGQGSSRRPVLQVALSDESFGWSTVEAQI